MAEKTTEAEPGKATRIGATVSRGTVLLLLRSSGPSRRAHVVASWARALLPTAALVIAPLDVAKGEIAGQDAIAVDADEIASGPLSLADAIAKAVARG